MQVLRKGFSLDDFFAELKDASRRVLLLDYDGTLAPFHPDPSRAYPYAGVTEALEKIAAAGHTRLVLVTGRSVSDLLFVLPLVRPPEIWGAHGFERRTPDGQLSTFPIGKRARSGLRLAGSIEPELVRLGGRLERKAASLAVHHRGLNHAAAARLLRAVRRSWREVAAGHGLSLERFAGGLELRVPGRDKGTVVRSVLREMGRATAAAYLGDDLTDEDAFAAIRSRGIGILVRKRLRRTAADVWLRPPAELRDFLRRWRRVAGAA